MNTTQSLWRHIRALARSVVYVLPQPYLTPSRVLYNRKADVHPEWI